MPSVFHSIMNIMIVNDMLMVLHLIIMYNYTICLYELIQIEWVF